MEDRLALGLTAPRLAYLLAASLLAYSVYRTGWPGLIRIPVAVVCATIGVVVAYGRVADRPLDHWVLRILLFYTRPRVGNALMSTPRMPARRARIPMLSATVDSARESWLRGSAGIRHPLAGRLHRQPRAQAPADMSVSAEVMASSTDDDPQSSSELDDAGPRVLVLPGRHQHNHDDVDDDPPVDDNDDEDVEAQPSSEAAPWALEQPERDAPVFVGGMQRIAFFSTKGGVGKTTLSTEVATMLSRDGRFRRAPGERPERLRVALLDLDLASANVSMKVGLTHPTLWDLVTQADPQPRDIEATLVEHTPSRLRILLGPPRAVPPGEGRSAAVRRVAEVLTYLEDSGYHFVVIDLSTEINDLTAYVLEAVQQVYYVFTPNPSAVQDAYRGVELLRRMGHRRKLRLVLNQDRGDFDCREMLADLGAPLAARVPRDDAFVSAEERHRPLATSGAGRARGGVAALAAAVYPAMSAPTTGRSLWRRLRSRLA